MPNIVARTSFKKFSLAFGRTHRMRRLSQALQIECKTWSVNMHRQFEVFSEQNGCKQSHVSKESTKKTSGK